MTYCKCKGTYPSDPPSPIPSASATSVYMFSPYYHLTTISVCICISTLRSDPPLDPPPLDTSVYISLSYYRFTFISFVHTYFHSPVGSSVGPYHIHTFILWSIFNYRTISIYIISRTFYSLP